MRARGRRNTRPVGEPQGWGSCGTRRGRLIRTWPILTSAPGCPIIAPARVRAVEVERPMRGLTEHEWHDEMGALIRSLREEELRELVNRFFKTKGLFSDAIHGSTEHGKDIVAVVPAHLDPLGQQQVLLVQVKAGDVNEARWRAEIKPQFREMVDHYIRHYAIDEKWPKRHVLVCGGRLTGQARDSVLDYNSRSPVPAEIVDVDRLASLMIDAGFHRSLVLPDDPATPGSDRASMEAVLACLASAAAQYEHAGLAFRELTARLPWLSGDQINQAVDALVDMGIVVPVAYASEAAGPGDGPAPVTRSFRCGEVVSRAHRDVLLGNGRPSTRDIEKHAGEIRRFMQGVMSSGPDLVVPVARKGARLLNYLLPNTEDQGTALVPLDLLSRWDDNELSGKRALLVDDIIVLGTTLAAVAEQLAQQGPDVRTCALVAHGGSPPHLAPDVAMVETSTMDELAEASARLALLLGALCPPYEPGRPVFTIDARELDAAALCRSLSSLGRLFSIGSPAEAFGKRLLVLSSPTFEAGASVDVPDLVREAGPPKLRLYVDCTGRLTIVPIVVLEAAAPAPMGTANCPGVHGWPLAFCKALPPAWYAGDEGRRCVECCDFHLSSHLGAALVDLICRAPAHVGMEAATWRAEPYHLRPYFRYHTAAAEDWIQGLCDRACRGP